MKALKETFVHEVFRVAFLILSEVITTINPELCI